MITTFMLVLLGLRANAWRGDDMFDKGLQFKVGFKI
jgi:hypothetical protein